MIKEEDILEQSKVISSLKTERHNLFENMEKKDLKIRETDEKLNAAEKFMKETLKENLEDSYEEIVKKILESLVNKKHP